jgi:uncharacterized protein YdbL (DUF1318 family)
VGRWRPRLAARSRAARAARAGRGSLALALALAACVPVTVNITFPQEKLDSAARQIEDATLPAGPGPGAASAGPAPRTDIRSPAVVEARESRRARRATVREWKSRGCIGEDRQGLAVARPGEGCGPEVAALIRAENADRRVIYDGFMKENHVPASDLARVQSAFARARQERSRPNDWIQLETGEWVRKP